MFTLEVLREYASKGWKLFPLWQNNKNPCFKGWPDLATDNIDQIISWNTLYKNPNWGVVTGIRSGIIVVDIDNKDIVNLDSFPKTLTSKTGSGGFHFYYKYPGKETRNSVNKDIGIDIRGDGGYAVLPPSIHPNGNLYEWLNSSEIVDLPEAILVSLYKQPEKKGPAAMSETIDEGERNDTLFRYACTLRGRGFSEESILHRLDILNQRRCNPPLDDKEIETIAHSAAAYEQGKLTQPIEFSLTDTGNAERLVFRHNDKIRFCFDLDQWLFWNGKKWEIDKQGNIKNLAFDTAKSIYEEALHEQDILKKKNLGDWARNSLSLYRIRSMIELAKPLIPVSFKELDTQPYLVNLENGILNLETGELLPHDPKYYLAKIIHVDFEKNASCPKWLSFLDYIIPDKGTQIFIQKSLGYSLTGSTDAQALFFLYGSGANGKSTFIETIRNLFGEYAQRTDIEALLDSYRGNNATPYIVRLLESRFVVCSEVPDGKRFNDSLIKDLTGSDIIVARTLFKNPLNFLQLINSG